MYPAECSCLSNTLDYPPRRACPTSSSATLKGRALDRPPALRTALQPARPPAAVTSGSSGRARRGGPWGMAPRGRTGGGGGGSGGQGPSRWLASSRSSGRKPADLQVRR